MKLPTETPYSEMDADGVNLKTGIGDYCYWISCERINTPGRLVHWMAHLNDKTWVTAEHLRDLMRYAIRYANVDPYTEMT